MAGPERWAGDAGWVGGWVGRRAVPLGKRLGQAHTRPQPPLMHVFATHARNALRQQHNRVEAVRTIEVEEHKGAMICHCDSPLAVQLLQQAGTAAAASNVQHLWACGCRRGLINATLPGTGRAGQATACWLAHRKIFGAEMPCQCRVALRRRRRAAAAAARRACCAGAAQSEAFLCCERQRCGGAHKSGRAAVALGGLGAAEEGIPAQGPSSSTNSGEGVGVGWAGRMGGGGPGHSPALHDAEVAL